MADTMQFILVTFPRRHANTLYNTALVYLAYILEGVILKISSHKFLLLTMLLSCTLTRQEAQAIEDASASASSSCNSIVLADGCFWGMEAVFDHVKAVTQLYVTGEN